MPNAGYADRLTGAGGIASWQDTGLNAAQRAGLTGTRGAPPSRGYAPGGGSGYMNPNFGYDQRNPDAPVMRSRGSPGYGTQQMPGGVQIGQQPTGGRVGIEPWQRGGGGPWAGGPMGTQQPDSRFGGGSGYRFEGPTVRTDPLTGKRGYAPPDQLRDFYNMTGSLPGGETGLAGRQQNLTEWQAEQEQRYREAQMAANPANYAVVAAMGGRAPWQQSMTQQGSQPGQLSYPGTAYGERPQVSGAAPLTDQRGNINPGNVAAYNAALQAANQMPGGGGQRPGWEGEGNRQRSTGNVQPYNQQWQAANPVPSQYGNREGAQYGDGSGDNATFRRPQQQGVGHFAGRPPPAPGSPGYGDGSGDNATFRRPQQQGGVPTGRQMTSQQYQQLRPDERQAFGSAVTASQGRSLQDWEQENRRYAPNTNRAAMAAFR